MSLRIASSTQNNNIFKLKYNIFRKFLDDYEDSIPYSIPYTSLPVLNLVSFSH